MLIPLRQQHRLLAGPLGGGLARGVRGQDERRGRPRSGCAARGTPTSAALTRPRRARRLAHAPAALSSFVARSQMHLCPDGHRRMFTARARG
jgi:hypothetical protein